MVGAFVLMHIAKCHHIFLHPCEQCLCLSIVEEALTILQREIGAERMLLCHFHAHEM